MEISSIELHNFRNYEELKLEFSPDINVLIGQNAQGKTNLLEAIYMLGLTTSHRTNNFKELVRWNEDNARLLANVKKNTGSVKLEIDLLKTGKRAKVNNLTSTRLSNFIGNLNIVLFAPEDLDLVKGSPQGRRKFMDIEFGQMSADYIYNVSQFRTVLKNRNSYLKQSSNSIDDDYLQVLDSQLVEYGSHVIKKRFEFVEKLNAVAGEIHNSIAESEQLEIRYKTLKDLSLESSVEEIKDVYAAELKRVRQREEILQSTQVGPHHDDLIFYINDKEVTSFASQGQQRTVALSVRLAEIQIIKELTGEYPVLLLDDVFSELDSQRQTQMLKYIQGKVQTFITTPSLSDVNQELIKEPKIFFVSKGEITNG